MKKDLKWYIAPSKLLCGPPCAVICWGNINSSATQHMLRKTASEFCFGQTDRWSLQHRIDWSSFWGEGVGADGQRRSATGSRSYPDEKSFLPVSFTTHKNHPDARDSAWVPLIRLLCSHRRVWSGEG